LIHRSSRQFAVTDIGREFLRHARAMLIEADAADSAVQRHLVEPSGTVRFTCPLGMSSMLATAMPRFLEPHPKVCLVQHATNRFVDIVEEGYDLALRGHLGTLTDSNLINRRLIHTPWTLVASPVYLEQAGEPLTPRDLARHPAVMLGAGGAEGTWVLRREAGNESEEVSVNVRMRSDHMDTLKTVAAAGIGITALPNYLSRPEIESGSLKRVLPQWTAGEGAVTLLMASRRGQLPSVRALVEILVEEFGRQARTA
jgi:DNA-binding transcriptional LysR family regulator